MKTLMKILKKIIAILITIMLSLILIYNVYTFVSIKILNKELVTVNGYAILEVVSGSMEPTISVGDYIIIDTKDKNYFVNNVVTFKDENGAFVTHRIIKLNEQEMVTKGDNNDSKDDAMPVKNIVGKYVMRLNGLGRIINSLKNPVSSIMIFIIGILVCFLISTDKKGNVILDDEEKEFQKYLKQKEKKGNNKQSRKKKTSKKRRKGRK